MVQKNGKFGIVATFGILYFISFWLITIGYFTPSWLLINLTDSFYDQKATETGLNPVPWYNGSSCNSLGIVTRSCDDVIYSWFTGHNIRSTSTLLENAFKLITTSVVVVYTNASLLIIAVIFDLFKSSFYMSLLSISFGVLYPVAAILILVATIYVEGSYKEDTGFSAMTCTIAGSIMLIFYFGLIVYDKQYIKSSMASSSFEKSPKRTHRPKQADQHHAYKHDQSYVGIKPIKNVVNPQREWRLRRL